MDRDRQQQSKIFWWILSAVTILPIVGLLFFFLQKGLWGERSTLFNPELQRARTVSDSQGSYVKIPAGVPDKIISLSPAITQLLAAVNLQLQPSVEEGKARPRIEELPSETDFSAILSRQPTLVLAEKGQALAKVWREYEGANAKFPKLLELDVHSRLASYQSLYTVCAALRCKDKAENIIRDSDAKRSSVKKWLNGVTSPRSVLIFRDGESMLAMGQGHFLQHFMEEAKAQNVNIATAPWTPVDWDQVNAWNPSVILVPRSALSNPEFIERMKSNPAGVDRNVCTIEDHLLKHSHPNWGSTLEVLARCIHREHMPAVPSWQKIPDPWKDPSSGNLPT